MRVIFSPFQGHATEPRELKRPGGAALYSRSVALKSLGACLSRGERGKI
nr:hypothetical protein [Candidatus Sigynarchaeum springense]